MLKPRPPLSNNLYDVQKNQVAHSTGFFEIMNGRDVRVIQGCENLSFTLKPADAIVSRANSPGRILFATSRFSFRSRARYTSPIDRKSVV